MPAMLNQHPNQMHLYGSSSSSIYTHIDPDKLHGNEEIYCGIASQQVRKRIYPLYSFKCANDSEEPFLGL